MIGPPALGEVGELAEVVAVGGTHEVACAVVAAHLGEVMGVTARAGTPLPAAGLPPPGPRGQYDATMLTRRLAHERPPGLVRVGVTELDLCLPMFSHVFGEAEVGGGVAVVSMYRLRDRHATSALLYGRLARVACHEVGHALGLRHCTRPGCLMRFAGNLDALDRLRLELCADCARSLAVGRSLLAVGRAPR